MNNKNEIKKELYKQKPEALYKGMVDGKKWYRAKLENLNLVDFLVPVNESEYFNYIMEAHLLIRWLDSALIYVKL